MNLRIIEYLIVLSYLGWFLNSCNEEQQEPSENFRINFAVVSDSILPSEDSLRVELTFDKKTNTSGQILIRLSGDAVHTTDFRTKPEAVNGVITLNNIEKDAQKAELVIVRAADFFYDKTIQLVLESPSQGFVIGDKPSASVKILKNKEITDSINFTDVFIHISENEPQAYQINLKLNGTLTQTEQVVIGIINPEGVEYATRYSTQVAAVSNQLMLEVLPGEQTVSFKILPVNDNAVLGTYELKFTIKEVTGQLRKGAVNELTVKVEEDDIAQAEINSVADLKTMFDTHQGDFWITDDYFIEGVITSGNNVADTKTAYIQDNTGGIMLQFTLSNMLQLGDKVRLNLKNATGSVVNGQKSITTLADRAGVKLGSNITVSPEIITLTQLATGNYEGKRVKIEGVQFKQANGSLTFEGNVQISAESLVGVVTTHASATFSKTPLPAGTFSVTGIVGDWGNLLPQVYETDIVKTGK